MTAVHRAEDLQEWIAATTKQACDEDHLSVILQDGQLLCALANALDPKADLKVNKLRTAFHTRANVRAFLDWCVDHEKLSERDLFSPEDLLDGSDFTKVLHTLSVLYDKLGNPVDSDTDSSSGSGPNSPPKSKNNKKKNNKKNKKAKAKAAASTPSPASSEGSNSTSITPVSASSPATPSKKGKGATTKIATFVRGGFFGRKKKAAAPAAVEEEHSASPVEALSPEGTPEGTPGGTPPSTPPPLSLSEDTSFPMEDDAADALASPHLNKMKPQVSLSPFGGAAAASPSPPPSVVASSHYATNDSPDDARQQRTYSSNAKLNAFLSQVPPSGETPLQHPQRPAGPPKRASKSSKSPTSSVVQAPPLPHSEPPTQTSVAMKFNLKSTAKAKQAATTKPVTKSPETTTTGNKFASFLRSTPSTNNANANAGPVETPTNDENENATPSPLPSRAEPVRVAPSDTFAQKKAMFMQKAQSSTNSPVPMPRAETVAALTNSRGPGSGSGNNKLQAFIKKQPSFSSDDVPGKERSDTQSKLAAFLAKTGGSNAAPPASSPAAFEPEPVMKPAVVAAPAPAPVAAPTPAPMSTPGRKPSALAAFTAQVKNNRALSSLAAEPMSSAPVAAVAPAPKPAAPAVSLKKAVPPPVEKPKATTPAWSTPKLKPVSAKAAVPEIQIPQRKRIKVIPTPFTPRRRAERSSGHCNFVQKRGTYWQKRMRPRRFSLEDKRAKFMHGQLEFKEEQRRQKARGGAEIKHNLIVPGVQCYIPDKDDVWMLSEIVEFNERTKVVTIDAFLESGKTERREVDLKDPAVIHAVAGPTAKVIESLPVAILHDTPGGVEDMRRLRYLNEPSILYNLKQRFEASEPYTYTNDIVIAVNPYKWIDGLYGDNLHEQYLKKRRDSLRPHVYATSTAAYKHMTSNDMNQSILVSGESGAGKTETTKILMNHLATVAGGREDKTIAKVIDVNPLLESFGNAKTTRNDNSSRFGKFTQLQFNTEGRLIGAMCETYLLEKSRVVSIADGERNYHIFYQMLAGLPTNELSTLGLVPTKKYNYTGLLSDMRMPSIDDAQWFQSTRKSLTLIGLDQDAQTVLFQVLAGVLLLGELQFKESGDNGSAISSTDVLENIARLFGLSAESIEHALCNRTVITRNDAVTVPLVTVEAIENRDALAKTVYAKLFDWMVHTLNSAISTKDEIHGLIGVLDIFGFEDFKQNGFEQFCINYANEKLQQKFTTDVFKSVEDEYEREGLEWEHINYQDNQGIVDVIDGKMGIIAIMNDHLRQPRGTEEALVNKLRTNHEMVKGELNPYIEFPKVKHTQFIIHHYAGQVTYETVGFMEKHRDTLQNDLLELIRMSHIELVSELFKEEAEAVDPSSSGRKAATKSLGSQFKLSLAALMENIATTNTHYVRCIKPNPNKSATEFNKRMVTEQLRSAGVIEAIRITRSAYPSRLTPQELASRYCIMFPPSMKSKEDRRTCSVFMKAIGRKSPQEYQMGKTLIYFQSGVMEELEAMKSDFVYEEATCIQKIVLGFVYRRRYARMVRAAVVLQKYARMVIEVREYHLQRNATILLQGAIRKWLYWEQIRAQREREAIARAEKLRLEREKREEQERLERERERALQEERDRQTREIAEREDQQRRAREQSEREEQERIARELQMRLQQQQQEKEDEPQAEEYGQEPIDVDSGDSDSEEDDGGEWVDEDDAYDNNSSTNCSSNNSSSNCLGNGNNNSTPMSRPASKSVIDRLRSFKSGRGVSDVSEHSGGRRRIEELSCKAKSYMRNSAGSSATGGSNVSLEEENAMLRIENRNLKYDLELMREQCIELQAIILAINKSRKR